MPDISNDIYINITDVTHSVEFSDEGVISVSLAEQNLINNVITESPIQVEAVNTGPPGSGIGMMLKDYSIKAQQLVWNGVSNLNVDNGNSVYVSLEGNSQLQPITGWPGSSEEGKITLYIHQQSGPYTVSWPSEIKWVNGPAPELTTVTDQIDIIVLTSLNAGAIVVGFHIGRTLDLSGDPA